MDFDRLARRALRVGARQGMKFVGKRLRDSGARGSLAGAPGGKDSKPARPRQGSGAPSGTAARGSGRRGKLQSGGEPKHAAGARADYHSARSAKRQAPKQGFPKRPSGGYPGDFTGSLSPVYKPDLNGSADPGEVVWAWVPFEEDASAGKDRPVLIVGRDGRWLLGLMLSSQDHIPGSVGEIHTAHGADWINVGPGDWDRQGRPSEIRLDRIIRISPHGVRREGAIMPMGLYSQVVSNLE